MTTTGYRLTRNKLFEAIRFFDYSAELVTLLPTKYLVIHIVSYSVIPFLPVVVFHSVPLYSFCDFVIRNWKKINDCDFGATKTRYFLLCAMWKQGWHWKARERKTYFASSFSFESQRIWLITLGQNSLGNFPSNFLMWPLSFLFSRHIFSTFFWHRAISKQMTVGPRGKIGRKVLNYAQSSCNCLHCYHGVSCFTSTCFQPVYPVTTFLHKQI